jgi:hypothetical protein
MMTNVRSWVAVAGAILAMMLLAMPADAQHPFPVSLKGYDADGNVVTITPSENSTIPYSPKATCGTCHDYAAITEGFHFQQGYTQIADDYGTTNGKAEFILSPGMYGKW